jgi:hypothetical protein
VRLDDLAQIGGLSPERRKETPETGCWRLDNGQSV